MTENQLMVVAYGLVIVALVLLTLADAMAVGTLLRVISGSLLVAAMTTANESGRRRKR